VVVRRSIPEDDLRKLYSDETHAQVAEVLQVQSVRNRAVLRQEILLIAGWYSAGIAALEKPLSNHETNIALKKLQRHVRSLIEVLAETPGWARSEVGFALSLVRSERKLRSGEEVLPYGHPASNQWIFDKECELAFVRDLKSIDEQLTRRQAELGKQGRPKGPEHEAIEGLVYTWKHYRNPGPTRLPLLHLCELVLRPVAQWHERFPKFEAAVKEVLHGRKPPRKAGGFAAS
jgi:hypothetical protein